MTPRFESDAGSKNGKRVYLGKRHAPEAKDKLVTLGNKTMSINIYIYITIFAICKELSNFL